MQSSKKENVYDIILVYGFFRAHNYYLNIVRYLSSQYKIGVYLVNAEKRGNKSGAKQMIKVKQTDDQFLSCLKSFGADILDEGTYSCGLLVIPQLNFDPDFVEDIDKRIKRDRAIAIQTFSYGKQLLEKFREIGIDKLLVYDKSIFYARFYTDLERAFVEDNFQVIEMGSPYQKYPVFDNIEIDYLVAFPSPMLIKDGFVRNRLLLNILSLQNNVNKKDKVVLKLHNVKDGGAKIFGSTKESILNDRGLILVAKVLSAVSGLLGKVGANKLSKKFIDRCNNLLHTAIEKRAEPLSNFTPYYNFGLELFLPMVKKGLITGISASIWYGLYNKLPVYNCDDQFFNEDKMPNGEIYKYFYVPPCGGMLKFDTDNFNKIPDSTIKADLIELIKKELSPE